MLDLSSIDAGRMDLKKEGEHVHFVYNNLYIALAK